jgi:hypothetical protein
VRIETFEQLIYFGAGRHYLRFQKPTNAKPETVTTNAKKTDDTTKQ